MSLVRGYRTEVIDLVLLALYPGSSIRKLRERDNRPDCGPSAAALLTG